MKVKDREVWQRFCARASKQKYEQSLLNFAIRWAARIVAKSGRGQPFDEVVEATIDEPNLELTNIQLAQVIAIMVNYWELGEELKGWFNRRWPIVREERGKRGL